MNKAVFGLSLVMAAFVVGTIGASIMQFVSGPEEDEGDNSTLRSTVEATTTTTAAAGALLHDQVVPSRLRLGQWLQPGGAARGPTVVTLRDVPDVVPFTPRPAPAASRYPIAAADWTYTGSSVTSPIPPPTPPPPGVTNTAQLDAGEDTTKRDESDGDARSALQDKFAEDASTSSWDSQEEDTSSTTSAWDKVKGAAGAALLDRIRAGLSTRRETEEGDSDDLWGGSTERASSAGFEGQGLSAVSVGGGGRLEGDSSDDLWYGPSGSNSARAWDGPTNDSVPTRWKELTLGTNTGFSTMHWNRQKSGSTAARGKQDGTSTNWNKHTGANTVSWDRMKEDNDERWDTPNGGSTAPRGRVSGGISMSTWNRIRDGSDARWVRPKGGGSSTHWGRLKGGIITGSQDKEGYNTAHWDRLKGGIIAGSEDRERGPSTLSWKRNMDGANTAVWDGVTSSIMRRDTAAEGGSIAPMEVISGANTARPMISIGAGEVNTASYTVNTDSYMTTLDGEKISTDLASSSTIEDSINANTITLAVVLIGDRAVRNIVKASSGTGSMNATGEVSDTVHRDELSSTSIENINATDETSDTGHRDELNSTSFANIKATNEASDTVHRDELSNTSIANIIATDESSTSIANINTTDETSDTGHRDVLSSTSFANIKATNEASDTVHRDVLSSTREITPNETTQATSIETIRETTPALSTIVHR